MWAQCTVHNRRSVCASCECSAPYGEEPRARARVLQHKHGEMRVFRGTEDARRKTIGAAARDERSEARCVEYINTNAEEAHVPSQSMVGGEQKLEIRVELLQRQRPDDDRPLTKRSSRRPLVEIHDSHYFQPQIYRPPATEDSCTKRFYARIILLERKLLLVVYDVDIAKTTRVSAIKCSPPYRPRSYLPRHIHALREYDHLHRLRAGRGGAGLRRAIGHSRRAR
jgi:hypothetical protein